MRLPRQKAFDLFDDMRKIHGEQIENFHPKKLKKKKFVSKCCGAEFSIKSGYEYDEKHREKLVFYCSKCGNECEMEEVLREKRRGER
jgi:ribosomal protein L31